MDSKPCLEENMGAITTYNRNQHNAKKSTQLGFCYDHLNNQREQFGLLNLKGDYSICKDNVTLD